MFRPAVFFIGLRYTRAKRRNLFISFISLVSMIGIALGVMVLITVLSVMNGFDQEIKQRIFSMVPPVTVTTERHDWRELQHQFMQSSSVTGSAPFAVGEVLLSFNGSVQPAMVTGIVPDQEKAVIDLSDKMIRGELADLQKTKFGIVLGENLADRLQVDIGDKVMVVTPQVSLSPAGVIPRYKRFTVTGVFRAGNGFGFDAGIGFINLADAQKLLALGNKVSGFYLNVKDVYAAPQFANDFKNKLPSDTSITTWADQFGEFFHAIKLEKTMMFIILMLIVAVAAFNLISTLVMVVNDKQADIAILRTLGATPKMIMAIFMIQGGLVSFLGTLLGVIGGVALASHVTEIVNWIEQLFHIQLLSSNIYFVSYLPSDIEWTDILNISIISLLLSLTATIYPAWHAAKMDPVESLRYE